MSAVAPIIKRDFSRLDWEYRIQHYQSLLPDGVRDSLNADAGRALAIYNKLCLPDVVDQPKNEGNCGEWLTDLVQAVGGTVENGRRWCNEFFTLIPKKNNKTGGGAAIMLTMTLMNKRPNAEFLICSPSLEVSNIAFESLCGMIEADRDLKGLFHVKQHIKLIIFKPYGSFIKVKSASPAIVTGSKPTGILIDELHVLGEYKQADRILGQIRGGMLARPEAFMLTITTQSERQPTGVFASELKKARGVRDGNIDLPICPLIYELPKNLDWRDSKNWAMVNPNNGYSLHIEDLVTSYRGAESDGEAELSRWASQHLNVEIGVGLTVDTWIAANFWQQNADRAITLDYLIATSDTLMVGIDGGGMADLLGFAVIGRHSDTGRWNLWTHAWVHPQALVKLAQDSQNRLRDFEDDGDLTFCENIGDDMDELGAICGEIYNSGLLGKIGVDQHGIGSIVDTICAQGIPIDRIVAVSQGYRLNGAILTCERKLADGTLKHQGSRLMDWCIGNCRIEKKGSANVITKEASKNKIDPVAALLNATSLMMMTPVQRVDVESWIG